LDLIGRLLEAGVDVNQPPAARFGGTALQLAAIHGQFRIARLLIENGANVNAPGSAVGGRTALEAAAEYGRLDIAKMLLDQGFDSTSRQERVAYIQAMRYAINRGHFSLQRMLHRHRTWTEQDEYLDDNLVLQTEHATFYVESNVLDLYA